MNAESKGLWLYLFDWQRKDRAKCRKTGRNTGREANSDGGDTNNNTEQTMNNTEGQGGRKNQRKRRNEKPAKLKNSKVQGELNTRIDGIRKVESGK